MTKIKNMSNKEKLYVLSYLFAFLYSFLPSTMIFGTLIPTKIGGILLLLSLAVMFVKVVLYDSFTIKELVMYSIILCILGINAIIIDYFAFFLISIIFIGSRNINPRLIVILNLCLLVSVLSIAVCLSLVGLIPQLTYIRPENGRVRYALGTIYPTVFGSAIFFVVLQYTYIKSKLSNVDFIAFFIVAVGTYYLTDAKLATILLAAFILGSLYYSRNKFENKLIVKGWPYFYFIPVIVIMLLSLFYNESTLFLKIDNILSGRIELSNIGFEKYGVTLLGQVLPITGWGGQSFDSVQEYFYLDALPVAIILRNGLLALGIYLLYHFIGIKTALKNKNFKLAIILTFVIIFDVIDDKGIKLSFNPFPLVVSSYLYSEIEKKEIAMINKNTVLNYFKTNK